MPEMSASRGGGIFQVGSSILRLLNEKHREQQLEWRVLSLGQWDDDPASRSCKQEWGERATCYGKQRLAFSRAACVAMASWADLVIVTHSGLAMLLALIPRRLRPVSITLLHGVEAWRPLPLHRRLALRASDYVVANSRFTARLASQNNPWLANLHCCHLGIPLTVAAAADDNGSCLGITPAAHDILIVGRMAKGEPGKGHRELIAAMNGLVAEVPDARLLIAGTGNDVQSYIDVARGSSVSESIHFLGYVPDERLRELYRHVGAFAMPSRQEGFGLVYLEAMAAGLPCLASTYDAASEVVADGETGLLVDSANGNAVVAALAKLLLDEAYRKKLGLEGRKRFEDNFTEQRYHERLWRLFEDALARRRHRAADRK
jgi:glycosyltransferase involved in cell wall biosynthesis